MEYPYPDRVGELLILRDISLNYGRLNVLRRLNLTLKCSEVHAIVGEHGAGKSSMGKVISGMLKPKSGTIVYQDRPYSGFKLKQALSLGIEMVYQDAYLNENFTVAENLFFTNKAIKVFTFNYKKRLLNATQSFLSRYGFELDPAMPLKNLNLSDRTTVDILKHLYPQPRLLILDEALEKLTPSALEKITRILMSFKRAGMAIISITHRIDDIYNFADKISIIRNGEIVVTDHVKNINKMNLIRIAYTQLASEPHIPDINQEFYRFLKYNEAILRSLPVNLIVTDNEHRIKIVNESCKEYFQLHKISYLNEPLEHLFSETNEDALNLITGSFSSPEEKTFYHVPIAVNGIHTINNIKTFPIYDGTFLLGNIITIEDMTEYDQLQKQLMLSEKLASVGLLAAGVAHEINNPLEIIYNYLSYIKYNFSDEKLYEAIDNVHEEISSISNIVSNLLTFSDNQNTVDEETDINELVRGMLNLIKYNAKYKHIHIQFDSYHDDITIRANKNQIKQVILNLLKNSFEAMPSGGEIYIRTSQVINDGVDFVRITFKDTGPGIKDVNPNNIFLPFYSTKKGQEENLGLGLSVSYGIIKKYNGTISVTNLADSGCQFVIDLPRFVRPAPIPAPNPSPIF